MACGGQQVWLKPGMGVPWEGRQGRRRSINLKPTFPAALVGGSLVNSGNQGDSEKASKEKRPGLLAKQLLLKYLRSTGWAGGVTGVSRGPWPGEGRRVIFGASAKGWLLCAYFKGFPRCME